MRRAPSSFCSSSSATSSGSRRGRVALAGFGKHVFLFVALSGIHFRVGGRLFLGGRRAHLGGCRGAGLTPHPPVHPQGIFQRFGDDVRVALFGQPLGQRRGFVVSTNVLSSTARTVAPASITSVVRLR